MTVASFTGAEAEELRRAVGMRRSMQRMKDLEGRLRDGMTRNGIGAEAQDNIVQGISSFAMYGFPESHAASFALIAYASAYLKVHYLAAFTCGLLNNQPMGFYSPAVLVKDAQRHGLRVRPIDVQRSEWLCTLEKEDGWIAFVADGDELCEGIAADLGRGADCGARRGGFQERGRFDAARAGAEPQRTGCAGADWRAECAGRSGASARCAVAGGVGGKAGGSAAARSGRTASQRVSKSASQRVGFVRSLVSESRPGAPGRARRREQGSKGAREQRKYWRKDDAAEADDDRGTAGGGLCGDRADDRTASDGISPRGVAGGGSFFGEGTGGVEERQAGGDCRMRDCAAAAGDGEGVCVFVGGGRDGNCECDFDAGCF